MARRVTIGDVAERLGLSKASVSYALNDQPGVSPETRRQVREMAAQLGWYPSSSARGDDAAARVLDPSVLRCANRRLVGAR